MDFATDPLCDAEPGTNTAPTLVRVPGRGVVHLLDPQPPYAQGPNLIIHGHSGVNVYVAPEDIKPATPADLAAYLPDERARGLECRRADCWCRWFNPLPAGGA